MASPLFYLTTSGRLIARKGDLIVCVLHLLSFSTTTTKKESRSKWDCGRIKLTLKRRRRDRRQHIPKHEKKTSKKNLLKNTKISINYRNHRAEPKPKRCLGNSLQPAIGMPWLEPHELHQLQVENYF